MSKETLRKYNLNNIPFYEPGKAPRIDMWHETDYLDEYHLVCGREWGCNGIGKLREVALVRPSEFDDNEFARLDPEFFLRGGGFRDLAKWQEQHENYAKILREEGVNVNYIEIKGQPMAPYGPMTSLWAAAEILVIRGGAIVPRLWHPINKGRERVYARWLVEQGCPILLTVHGKGIAEVGASLFLAEDVFVTALSVSYNQEGLDQVLPVFTRTGTKEALVMKMPGLLEKGALPDQFARHPDQIIAPVDLGVAIIYPKLCDFETIKWLRKRKFKMIEISSKEQRVFLPANLTIIEPGKVVMAAGANEVIKKVRAEGIDVIEVDLTQQLTKPDGTKTEGVVYGGPHCSTLLMHRDKGPGLEEITH